MREIKEPMMDPKFQAREPGRMILFGKTEKLSKANFMSSALCILKIRETKEIGYI